LNQWLVLCIVFQYIETKLVTKSEGTEWNKSVTEYANFVKQVTGRGWGGKQVTGL